ncbi:MAG: hypothetical protein K6F73_02955 [Lachnospiraceae bacterium]|nr:hypothetical protein [Lachnospiraceae bacterium]
MYRKQDLQYLQDIFARESNDIAIVYGMRSVGLSEIILDFVKDKECLYYQACPVIDGIQRVFFASELYDQTKSPIFPDENYENLLTSFINDKSERKKLIVYDDFQYLIKENPTFINFLASLLFERVKSGTVMLLLVSDDIKWIENDMIKLTGRKSYEISGVLKLNGYSAAEFRQCFPDMPLNEVMAIYSFVGPKSRYYNRIEEGMTCHDFIIEWLKKWAEEDADANLYIPHEIREPMLYNTILYQIAAGSGKLNDIHNAVGIDRAKLSVYIKTLIENGLVEKAISAAAGDPKNTLKGVYMIKDETIRFYYRFVFPHLSSLRLLGADRFYRKYVEAGFTSFVSENYHRFCMELIRWLNKESRLNFKVARIEEYYDKSKAIDFIVTAAGGSVIACACQYGPHHMNYKKYEEVRAAVRKNKLPCDNIWLFSSGGFDQKLSMFGSVTPGVKLIEGSEQRLR